MKSNVVHHSNLWSLCAFAEIAECFIYIEQWKRVSPEYPSLSVSDWGKYQIECCWSGKIEENQEQKMWFVMFNDSVPKESVYNYKHLLRLTFWSKESFGTHFDPAETIGDMVSRSPRNPLQFSDSNDCETTQALAASWLSK